MIFNLVSARPGWPGGKASVIVSIPQTTHMMTIVNKTCCEMQTIFSLSKYIVSEVLCETIIANEIYRKENSAKLLDAFFSCRMSWNIIQNYEDIKNKKLWSHFQLVPSYFLHTIVTPSTYRKQSEQREPDNREAISFPICDNWYINIDQYLRKNRKHQDRASIKVGWQLLTLKLCNSTTKLNDSYPAAMPQCSDAALAAFSNNDKPTSETVGTIVSGVIYFSM